ncbi:hypothetical protein CPI84_11430 [Erwinia pyrifoliae]|nr:hypothetical protein CPI84_11430 [Erwinia pyrifoliae]
MEPKFLSMIEKTIIIFSSRNGYIKKENSLVFLKGIDTHIKISNSQPFKGMCQIKSQLIQIRIDI